MGVSLTTYLNHDLSLAGRTLPEALALVQPRLDALVLDNAAFLQDFALHWHEVTAATAGWPATWQFVPDDPQWYDFDTSDYKTLRFEGPHNLALEINDHNVEVMNPPYRYRQWFGLQNADGTEAVAHRDAWRRYFRQVARAFGGDRALYLPDSGPSPLAAYASFELSVTAAEQELPALFGPPKATFWEVYDVPHRDVYEGRDTSYFVDYFRELPA